MLSFILLAVIVFQAPVIRSDDKAETPTKIDMKRNEKFKFVTIELTGKAARQFIAHSHLPSPKEGVEPSIQLDAAVVEKSEGRVYFMHSTKSPRGSKPEVSVDLVLSIPEAEMSDTTQLIRFDSLAGCYMSSHLSIKFPD